MPVYIVKSGDLIGCYRYLTHRQTSEYRATQLVSSIKHKLSHAIKGMGLSQRRIIMIGKIQDHIFHSFLNFFWIEFLNSLLFDQLLRKGCALEWPESAKKVEKVIQKIFLQWFHSYSIWGIQHRVFLWIRKYLFVAPLSGSGIHLDWLGLSLPSKSQTSYFPPFAFYFLEAKTLSFLAARFCRSFLCCGNLLLFLLTKFALADDTFFLLLNFACYSIALLFSKSGE